MPANAVHEALGSSPEDFPGLAERRLAERGPNELPSARRPGAMRRFLGQFNNLLIYVLLVSAATTWWLGDVLDTVVILGVVLINAVIGFVQEGKAERALDAVSAMLASQATAWREGRRQDLPAAALVVGDVVWLESGARVPADLRLWQTRNLRIDEAALTGESVPVEKATDAVAEAVALGDRVGMAYAGTVVTQGQAMGTVVATGQGTELGRIGHLVSAVGQLATPLARRLDQFARQITLVILVVSALAFWYGLEVGARPMLEMFLAVVGLAVAAIPEGLPAIVTIALAIGTAAMANRRAIVRRLPAVETLGSVGVICTDKTGTLTRNEMSAVGVYLADEALQVEGVGYAPDGAFKATGQSIDPAARPALLSLAECACLCNDAQLHHDPAAGWTVVGDPTEGALLALALKAGLDPAQLLDQAPRIDAIPFESERRCMATLHRHADGRVRTFLKGRRSGCGRCAPVKLAGRRWTRLPGRRGWRPPLRADKGCWHWRRARCPRAPSS
ncbi:MAG: HAD-IC family P-type ATPase [Burkholderiaceae bacterium]